MADELFDTVPGFSSLRRGLVSRQAGGWWMGGGGLIGGEEGSGGIGDGDRGVSCRGWEMRGGPGLG